MRVMHRIIHQIAPDKWGEVMAWEAKFRASEEGYDIPPYRWYRAGFGAETNDTLVSEQEWESMADFEERYSRVGAQPSRQKLEAESRAVFLDSRHELYMILE